MVPPTCPLAEGVMDEECGYANLDDEAVLMSDSRATPMPASK